MGCMFKIFLAILHARIYWQISGKIVHPEVLQSHVKVAHVYTGS